MSQAYMVVCADGAPYTDKPLTLAQAWCKAWEYDEEQVCAFRDLGPHRIEPRPDG